MERTLRLWVAGGLLIGLTACHQLGGGYAERVDVPLSVSLTMTGTPKTDCKRVWCTIPFEAIVTDQGTEPVYARGCSVRALDKHGRTILESVFGFEIGPGLYTEPGNPGRTTESLSDGITRAERARVRSLEGTCLAYSWHGSAPI